MEKGNCIPAGGNYIASTSGDYEDMGVRVRPRTTQSRATACKHYRDSLRAINKCNLPEEEQCRVELLGKFAMYLFEARKAPAYKTALSYLTGVKMHFETLYGKDAYFTKDPAFMAGKADYLSWYTNIRYRIMKSYLKRDAQEEVCSERATEPMYRFHLLVRQRNFEKAFWTRR